MDWMIINLLGVILKLAPIEVGAATVFYAEGDKYNPNPNAACLGRNLNDKTDFIIAHRTLPCRSKVLVINPANGKSVMAIVGDRGPYGRKANGKFRAIADLSHRVNQAIGGNGYSQIILMPQPRKKLRKEDEPRNEDRITARDPRKCPPEVCWTDD